MDKEALISLMDPDLEIPDKIWEIVARTAQTPSKPKPLDFLLIEDIPVDVCIVAEGLSEILPLARLSVARDGVEALNFLRQAGKYANAPRPDLILLDLRLQKRTGFDVLQEIKADPGLASIPVIVQTSSDNAADIQEAYRLHANSYIIKPTTLDEFNRSMQALVNFWVTVAKLPGREDWKAI